MAKEETVLIIGGVVVVGALLFIAYQRQAQQAQLNALNNLPSTIDVSDPIGGIVAGIGSLFGTGAISDIKNAFTNTGSLNEPGLITNYSGSNSPGLDNGDDDDDYGY